MIGIVFLLRDVLARSLFAKYQSNFVLLNRILDAYEFAVNRISNTVAARDEGPGIPDFPRSLQVGISMWSSLVIGWPGVRRLMDAFKVVSEVNRGTTVTVKKWTILRGD